MKLVSLPSCDANRRQEGWMKRRLAQTAAAWPNASPPLPAADARIRDDAVNDDAASSATSTPQASRANGLELIRAKARGMIRRSTATWSMPTFKAHRSAVQLIGSACR
jgi:hypothetical protein